MMIAYDIVNNPRQMVDSEFTLKLRNIYSAENYCLRRIPGLLKKIPDNRLHHLLKEQLATIIERKTRLEKIFDDINVKTSGAVCMTFKALIFRVGTSIYYINQRRQNCFCDLLSTLIEISIYRCSIYNFLKESIDNDEKAMLTNVLKLCLREEDEFFHSLLKIKENMGLVELTFAPPAFKASLIR